MIKTINISDDFKLPLDIAAQAIVEVGIRGSGKTNTARSLAEELLKAGVPICVVDPTDAWFGIRSTRDGKGEGYPVFIFGGDHGDLPLEESHGKTIAEFLVTDRVPVILSLRHLRKNAQRRFVTELCEELYHLKGKPQNRSPLTVFIDESPLFIPQRMPPAGKGEWPLSRCVGAVEDLIARGRNAGFGVVLISQRFATINKDVSTQAGTIICHRLTSPQDRKAIAEWIEENATIEQQRDTLSSLATLQNGEAWLWAPALDIYKRVQIRLSETFDSGATPKMGSKPIEPKKLAEIDRDKLKERMASAVELKKANDPSELKKQLAATKAELTKALTAKTAPPGKSPPAKIKLKPVITDKQLLAIERMGTKLDAMLPKAGAVLAELEKRQAIARSIGDQISAAVRVVETALIDAKRINGGELSPAAPSNGMRPLPDWPGRPYDHGQTFSIHNGNAASSAGRVAPPAGASRTAMSPGRNGKKSPQDRILSALRWWEAIGVNEPTVSQLAPIAGYAPSGSFDTYLSRLGSAGLIERSSGVVRLLPEGASITPATESPPDLASLHATVLATLDGPQTKIVSALLAHQSGSVAVADLAAESGYAPSGSFDTYLSRLGSRGLIERKKGKVSPTAVLFPEGVS